VTQPGPEPQDRQSAEAAGGDDSPDTRTSPEAGGRIDIAALLAEGARGAGAQDPAPSLLDEEPPDDAPDDEDDEDAGATDGLAEDDDDEGEDDSSDDDDGDDQPDELTTWAESLVKNPKALSRIPEAQRVAAIERAIAMTRESTVTEQQSYAREALTTVAQAAYDEGIAIGRELATAEVEFAEIEQMVKDEDDAGLGTLIRDDPEKWDRYRAWKNGQDRPSRGANGKGAGRPGGAPQVEEAIAEEAGSIMAELKKVPGALERMQANETKSPGIYAPNAEGLKRYRSDAITAIAEAKAAEMRKKEEPSRKAVERRQKAAEQRKDLPRVPGGNGRTASRGPDLRNLSPRELVRMGVSKAMES